MQSIRDLRLERSLTQEALAQRSGLSLRTVIRAEHGTHEPTARTRAAIAQALGCDPEMFVTHEADGTSAAPARGNRTPRRRTNAPGHGSTEEPREQSAV